MYTQVCSHSGYIQHNRIKKAHVKQGHLMYTLLEKLKNLLSHTENWYTVFIYIYSRYRCRVATNTIVQSVELCKAYKAGQTFGTQVDH